MDEIKLLSASYLALQVGAQASRQYGFATDSLRAKLRDRIAALMSVTPEELQNNVELQASMLMDPLSELKAKLDTTIS